jgi:nitrite reductase/ring-hydroxylating ferredoxin subunit
VPGRPWHTVLGENFVVFRDSAGRLGFLDELCCHRGASLVLGRVEQGGIRCLYHGWKYAADGTILETPNLATPTFRERFRHGACPVREAGGLGWVYLGPAGTEPPFPAFSWTGAAPDELVVSEMIMDCNWMQVQEGSIDSSHVAILHLDTLATMGAGPRTVGSFDFPGEPWDLDMPVPGRGRAPAAVWPSDDNAPRIEVENTPFGFHYAAIRDVSGDPGKKFVRVTAFAMPYTAFIGGTASGAVIVVPRDDYSCSSIGVFTVPAGAGGIAAPRRPRGDGRGPELRRLPRREQDPGRRRADVGRPAVRPRRSTSSPRTWPSSGCGGCSPTRSGWWPLAQTRSASARDATSRGSALPRTSSTPPSPGRTWCPATGACASRPGSRDTQAGAHLTGGLGLEARF